jgi:hypothetical protein
VGKAEDKRPLGRPMRRWKDNMKIDIQEVGSGKGYIDWVDLAQERKRWPALVNAIINLRFPSNAGNFLTT